MKNFIANRNSNIKDESELTSDEILQKSRNTEWLLVNPRILLGLFGFVACFGWLFLALGTSIYVPFADLPSSIVGVFHLCFAVGICVSLLVSWLVSDFFARHKVFQFSLAAFFALLSCVGLMVYSIASVWFWALALAMGCGFGFLYSLYGEFVCIYLQSSFRAYLSGISAAAILLCAGFLFVGPEASFWFAILFPILALAVYGFEMAYFRLQKRPYIDKKLSDCRQEIVWRSFLSTATIGMAIGFALGCILATQHLGSWVYVAGVILVFVVCVLFLMESLRKRRLNEAVSMKIFLPFSAIVVFPLIFVSEEFRPIFALLLLCGAMFPVTMSLSAMCKHIVICKLAPIRAFSFGRLMTFTGIVFGMVIAFLGFSEATVQQFGTLITIFAVIFYMALVIFSASFVMTEDNYPEESRFVKSASEEGGKLGSFVADKPAYKTNIDPSVEVSEKGEKSPDRHGVFYKKCEIVARQSGLSSRQKEVLVMLAKGRNADYITEKLVISSHTAKAHIYNIYQKTGVHSRQELMNLVERTNLPE